MLNLPNIMLIKTKMLSEITEFRIDKGIKNCAIDIKIIAANRIN